MKKIVSETVNYCQARYQLGLIVYILSKQNRSYALGIIVISQVQMVETVVSISVFDISVLEVNQLILEPIHLESLRPKLLYYLSDLSYRGIVL